MVSRQLRTNRAGFTLIEILVVITIIAILAALTLAALVKVQDRRSNTERYQELDLLKKGLEEFKTTHGVFPPSRVYMLEDGDYSPTRISGLGLDATVAATSARYLKLIFPEIKIKVRDTDALPPAPANQRFDFNGDGDSDDLFLMQGDQCLVFFLAGVPDVPLSNTTSNVEQRGFVRSGWNPCPIDLNDSFARLRVRTLNLHDSFQKPGMRRLEYKACTSYTGNAVNMPVIIDPDFPVDSSRLATFYYFSAYEGAGYQPSDGDEPGEQSAVFQIAWPTKTTVNSPGPNPYTIGAANPGTGGFVKFHRSETYQLIAPGQDGLYGVGGPLPEDGSHGNGFGAADTGSGGGDNMVNFAGGKRLRDVRIGDVESK